jgi:hypothetical protein
MFWVTLGGPWFPNTEGHLRGSNSPDHLPPACAGSHSATIKGYIVVGRQGHPQAAQYPPGRSCVPLSRVGFHGKDVVIDVAGLRAALSTDRPLSR